MKKANDLFKTKKTKAATVHPIMPDINDDVAPSVDDLVTLSEQRDILDAQIKNAESVVKEAAADWFFRHYSGKTDIPSSIKVAGLSEAVLVQFTSRCYPVKLDAKNAHKADTIRKLFGGRVDDAYEEGLKFEIDGNEIASNNRPQFMVALAAVFNVFGHGSVTDDEQAVFVDNLTQLIELGGFDRSNGEPSEAITAQQTLIAKKSLHHERHTLLTPAQNKKLHAVAPYVVSVKRKGVV